MATAFHIKVRKKGGKSWAFLSDGGTNRLRVHAVRYTSREQADRDLRWHETHNPDHDFKVQEA